jgi:hypothetical protein
MRTRRKRCLKRAAAAAEPLPGGALCALHTNCIQIKRNTREKGPGKKAQPKRCCRPNETYQVLDHNLSLSHPLLCARPCVCQQHVYPALPLTRVVDLEHCALCDARGARAPFVRRHLQEAPPDHILTPLVIYMRLGALTRFMNSRCFMSVRRHNRGASSSL